MASQAKINRVKELWLGLPENWRTQLAGIWHTFIPAFFTSLLVSLEALEGTPVTKDILLATASAIILAALRSGFKAVSVAFFVRVLPDPKDTK